jgi:hypothetical protein
VAEHTFFSELCSRVELCYWKNPREAASGLDMDPDARLFGAACI